MQTEPYQPQPWPYKPIRPIRPELDRVALNMWTLQRIMACHAITLIIGTLVIFFIFSSTTSYFPPSKRSSCIDMLIFVVVSDIINIVIFFFLKITLPENSLQEQRVIIHIHDFIQQFVFCLFVKIEYPPGILFSKLSILVTWAVANIFNKITQQMFIFLFQWRINSLLYGKKI